MGKSPRRTAPNTASPARSREVGGRFARTRAQAANKNGSFAWEITPMALKAGKDERFMEMDESPFKANFDKIRAQARVQEGRHHHRGQLVFDFGRGAAVVMTRPLDGGKTRTTAPAIVVGHSTHAQEPAVYHGAGRRDQQSLRQDRLELGHGRSVRNQRSVRRRHHGGDEGTCPPRRRSISTAAPVPWDIRSAPPERASW